MKSPTSASESLVVPLRCPLLNLLVQRVHRMLPEARKQTVGVPNEEKILMMKE